VDVIRPGTDGKAVSGMGTPRAWCVLAPNPSPMTLDGTNTWVIAEPGTSAVVVVDPGPDDEGHLRRVLDAARAGDRHVAQVVLTHGHLDHSAGARRFAELSGAPVGALDPGLRLGTEGYGAGDVITAGGCELRVVATPGHTADSLSLLLPADGGLLTGDTVLGRGTTVIAGDGSLGDYLRTLDELRSLADTAALHVLLPGHGPLLTDPAGVLDYYIAHRKERSTRCGPRSRPAPRPRRRSWPWCTPTWTSPCGPPPNCPSAPSSTTSTRTLFILTPTVRDVAGERRMKRVRC
jgi:glyoxylase-like metal-dependent hydrolase (beta-lactamase superfamily II)